MLSAAMDSRKASSACRRYRVRSTRCVFESRLFFVDMLIGLGARIVLCDPHRAVIVGPSQLRGAEVRSPDIRAGMAMLLAALAAEGESQIYNINQIDRGYERIDERLRGLGAQIERVGSPE